MTNFVFFSKTKNLLKFLILKNKFFYFLSNKHKNKKKMEETTSRINRKDFVKRARPPFAAIVPDLIRLVFQAFWILMFHHFVCNELIAPFFFKLVRDPSFGAAVDPSKGLLLLPGKKTSNFQQRLRRHPHLHHRHDCRSFCRLRSFQRILRHARHLSTSSAVPNPDAAENDHHARARQGNAGHDPAHHLHFGSARTWISFPSLELENDAH
jgi:hypothetical protein